jgi:excinuclease ABC subunit C
MTTFTFDGRHYPTEPGCYLMKNMQGRVIYVGKAKNLRRRLASYFQQRPRQRRIRRLIENIRDIEVILVNNEAESLILENNLIKLHHPRYNRALMRAGSGYPYIILTGEDFPRLLPYHKNRYNPELALVKDHGIAQRFGPFLNRRFRDIILAFTTENFGLRTCQPLPKRLCLLYHMGRCCGPCEGKAGRAEYERAVAAAVTFLTSAQHTELIREMKQRMWAFAEALAFERAQRIRDQVEALESLLNRQVVEQDLNYDQDVIYFGEAGALTVHFKQGSLQQVTLAELQSTPDRIAAFLLARYQKRCPPELIINEPGQYDEIEGQLRLANGYPVRIWRPEDGPAMALLTLAERNYRYRTTDRANPAETD